MLVLTIRFTKWKLHRIDNNMVVDIIILESPILYRYAQKVGGLLITLTSDLRCKHSLVIVLSACHRDVCMMRVIICCFDLKRVRSEAACILLWVPVLV